jgi:hypothetical protein
MSALTKAIQELTRGKVSELDESDQSALLQASYELINTLENAGEKILCLIFVFEGTHHMCTSLGLASVQLVLSI